MSRNHLLDAAWAKALYDAYTRFEPTPLYDEVAAELGDVLSIERRCA